MNSRIVTSLYAAGLLVAAGGVAPALAQTTNPPAPAPSQPAQAAPAVTPQNTPASKGTTMMAPSGKMGMTHHPKRSHMAKSHKMGHGAMSSNNPNAQNGQVADLNAQSLAAAQKGQAMQLPGASGMGGGGNMGQGGMAPKGNMAPMKAPAGGATPQ